MHSLVFSSSHYELYDQTSRMPAVRAVSSETMGNDKALLEKPLGQVDIRTLHAFAILDNCVQFACIQFCKINIELPFMRKFDFSLYKQKYIPIGAVHKSIYYVFRGYA